MFLNDKSVSRKKGIYRIGPHNIDILAIIFGSLLGDGYAEKRFNKVKYYSGTRINFYQESSHSKYLIYLHNSISELGYCNPKLPEIGTRLGSGGTIRKTIRFST
jgi:ubiquinol-cytochrome c reductase cytochrome b subunit